MMKGRRPPARLRASNKPKDPLSFELPKPRKYHRIQRITKREFETFAWDWLLIGAMHGEHISIQEWRKLGMEPARIKR